MMQNSGVIVWAQRLLVYRMEADGWHAQYLGDDQPVAIVEQLQAAIDADQRHQEHKRKGDES